MILADVRAYLDHVSRKYGVHANTRFDTDLKSAAFDEMRDVWMLECEGPEGTTRLARSWTTRT